MPPIDEKWLAAFLAESLRIEGIMRAPTRAEIVATDFFLDAKVMTVDALVALVAVYQPDAVLRNERGLDVRVGGYVAPRGGPQIGVNLCDLLTAMPDKSPWQNHIRYESLHPFTDGNGRSGRALWAWDMRKRGHTMPLLFLHEFYYQTLSSQGGW